MRPARPYFIGQCRVAALVAAVAALVVAQTSQAADPLLRWKFTKGETLKYTLQIDMTQAMDLGGAAVNVDMNQLMEMDWTVGDVDSDGNATITQKFSRVRMEMKTGQPQGDFVVDSSNTEGRAGAAQMIAPLIDAMVDQPVTMKVSPRGETSDVKVSQGMLDAFKKMPGVPGMGAMFSEDTVKQMMSHGMLKFPEAPATVGAHWTDTMTTKLPSIATQEVDTTYTYEGMESKDSVELAKIGMKQEQSFEPDPTAPFKLDIEKQTSDGTVLFDVAAGRTKSIDHESVMELTIDAAGNKIGQTVTTHMTMNLNAE